MRSHLALLVGLLVAAPAAVARQDVAVCGSYADRLREEVYLHFQSEALRARNRGGIRPYATQPVHAATQDEGNIVLMEDSEGVVSKRNEFDLDTRTVSFVPSGPLAGAYRYTLSEGGYDGAAAGTGSLIEGLADDDARLIRLPFPFPFFGKTYQEVFVNSDGNLTFGAPDTSTSERSLGRVTAGPPRIAPLFRDLDPSRALDGVRVLLDTSRVVVSWVSVPEFSEFSQGPLQTFQARLLPSGRIELAFNGITTTSAVAGIAPGGLLGATSVVSFSDASQQEFTSAVLERFTLLREVDLVLAAQKFYETHDDAYDYLVIYNNMGLPASTGAVAFEITLRNVNRSGYGDFPVDAGGLFGSESRLQAMMNMGPLSQYPSDPNAVVPARSLARDTPLTVLGHEAGHLFLAFASVRDPADPEARPMLGRQSAHWNFSFNSEASLLEGNRICDRERTPETCPAAPSGGRFVTTATVEGFSPLDQYLMGFRPPWEVPDTFLVENSTVLNPSRMPQAGVGFNGQRRDIRIEEIVQAEGRRTPDDTVAQRRFRFAFILIHPAGVKPPAEAIDKLDRYRREFEAFYRRASGERAWADTILRRGLKISTFPASGVLLGGTAQATVNIEQPAGGPVEVLLTSANGNVRVPASVTIATGSDRAVFSLTGVREGVDEIVAEAPGEAYQRAESRVRVLGSAADLRLVVISGDKQPAVPGQPLPQPVVLRVTDINLLPYAGLRITVTPSGGGTVVPTKAVADASGTVSFQWTPGPGPANDLTARIAGAPSGPTLTVSTTGVPLFTSAGVVNSASFTAPVSPGSLASIFGVNLAAGATAWASFPIPTELAEVRVFVNGRAAPLLYVDDRQINFVVPQETEAGQASMVVSTPLGQTGPAAVAVAPVAPAIFLAGSGFGAAVVVGTGKLTSERAAAPGEFLAIFATGLGAVKPDETGLFKTVQLPQVTLAGIPAEIQFSGLAPGFIGLYQVNARVPQGTPSGLQTLSLAIGGANANEVLVRIQ